MHLKVNLDRENDCSYHTARQEELCHVDWLDAEVVPDGCSRCLYLYLHLETAPFLAWESNLSSYSLCF